MAEVECEIDHASVTHCTRLGEQALPVRSEEAVLEASMVIGVSRTIVLTASATPEFGRSTMASTFSTSSQRRTMAEPTSGLFW